MLPCDALSVTLDAPVEAVVMINVMYALEPDYRKRLWQVLQCRWKLVACWSSHGAMAARPHPDR